MFSEDQQCMQPLYFCLDCSNVVIEKKGLIAVIVGHKTLKKCKFKSCILQNKAARYPYCQENVMRIVVNNESTLCGNTTYCPPREE